MGKIGGQGSDGMAGAGGQKVVDILNQKLNEKEQEVEKLNTQLLELSERSDAFQKENE